MKKLFTLLTILLALGWSSHAQTLSFSLTTAPCASNGVLQVSSTGLSGTVTYNMLQTGATSWVTNTTGTLTGYAGGPVYAYATNGSGTASATGTYAGAPPFNYTVSTTTGICPAPSTASVSITGGTAPYTVNWSVAYTSGPPVATGATVSLPSGSYTVHITDAASCTYGTFAKGDSIYVQNISPVKFSLTTTPAACTNGTVTVSAPTGGTAPYSYLWNNGATTSSLTGLVQGYYSVTVTDAAGCTQQAAASVTQTPVIRVNTTVTNASCLLTNGAATAFGSGGTGPYSYLWSNLLTTQAISGLTGGTSYSVKVTDINGCTGTGGAFINRTTPINATYTTVPSSCTTANGSATVAATGGTPPYTIIWSTFPVQTGTTASGLPPGSYGFTITDATGCVRTGSAYIPPVSIINASTYVANASCTATDGMAGVTVTSGASPYTYLWSNGATGNKDTPLAAGTYSVIITDNMGCQVTKYATIGRNSPISVGLSTTPATCIFNSNGSITATATGGTAPYTYSWSGGGSGATASSLATGGYYVYVSDAAGCTKSAYSYVGYNAANTSCYCTITGTVYNDANANCTKDAGETGIPNIKVNCSGIGSTFTDAAGVYSFRVPSGTYTLSQTIHAYYPLAPCQSNAVSVTTVAATGCTTTVNFADTTATIHDMKVQTISYGGPPVPGNTYTQTMIVKNEGTVTESSILTGYQHDGQLGTPSSVPSSLSLYSPGNYRNNSGFSTLAPAGTQSFNIQYSVPTNIPLLTSLVYYDTAVYASPMSNWLTDYTPWNNVHTYNSAVRGSFDPNSKEVSPAGTGPLGFIAANDSELTYTIHFQNTGNWPAQKVVLKDTLSSSLDANTLRPFAASHAYTTQLTDGTGIITFTFDNINLPDSNTNKLGSMGYVMYTIRQKKGLAAGTKIENSASIYFDYNAPVKTNTTLNTIQEEEHVRVPAVHKGQLVAGVYPNPASDRITIMIESDGSKNVAQVRIISLVGQVMQQQQVSMHSGRNLYGASTGNLASGMYFVEITDGTRVSTTKLSIVR